MTSSPASRQGSSFSKNSGAMICSSEWNRWTYGNLDISTRDWNAASHDHRYQANITWPHSNWYVTGIILTACYRCPCVTDLLEVSSLHRDVLHLSKIDVTKEMGHFSLRRQQGKKCDIILRGWGWWRFKVHRTPEGGATLLQNSAEAADMRAVRLVKASVSHQKQAEITDLQQETADPITSRNNSLLTNRQVSSPAGWRGHLCCTHLLWALEICDPPTDAFWSWTECPRGILGH